MKKVFFGGNWKCNNTLGETKGLIENIVNVLEFDSERVGNFLIIQRLLCPQFTCIW